ncbi:PilT-like protein [Beggiatoa sp. PS]|nr:PilT-like protein [Beggiatoa sp. PS]
MGTLVLPTSGSIYLDANCFIYSVEKIEPYNTLLKPMWVAAKANQFEIVSSELTLLETLTKPLQINDTTLENIFRALLNANEVRLIPTTTAIWEQATRFRAKTGLKTPDAIHAATALVANCTLFITNDVVFRRVSNLPVTILSDFIGQSNA